MTGVGHDPTDRGTLATVMTGTALFGTVAKGLVVDRPRIALAYPHAKAQQRVPEWAFQLLSGNATGDLVPTSGAMQVGRHLTIPNGWRRAYQASNALTIALVGVNMVYGIPNLRDGWTQDEGISGLLGSRPGRTGAIASIMGVGELALFGVAAAGTRGGGGSGRLAAILQHPIHGHRAVVYGRVAASAPILANELGLLDFLNRGDTRSAWQTARDTVTDGIERARSLVPGRNEDAS